MTVNYYLYMTAGSRMTDSPTREQDSDQGPEDLRSDSKKKKGTGSVRKRRGRRRRPEEE